MRARRWLTTLTVLLFASVPQVALALPFVDQPSPIPGFGADDGTELWIADPGVFSVELFDVGVPGTSLLSAFGFYFASDPTHLIPIFSAADQDLLGGADPQTAYVDFTAGIVTDVDASLAAGVEILEATFIPQAGPLGFFYALEYTDPSGPFAGVLYTQAALNSLVGGIDVFGTFRNESAPNEYLIGAEIEETPLMINFVGGINPIPEPMSGMLFAAGGLVVGFTLRKKARRS